MFLYGVCQWSIYTGFPGRSLWYPLPRLCYIVTIRNDPRTERNSCFDFCAKEKLSAKAEVKRYRAMMVEEPYSMVGLDLVGPFQADVFGYTYILVIRDFSSK